MRVPRLAIGAAVVLGLLFLAYKATYTYVPPQRLAVDEMIRLAGPVRTQIGERFQAFGTLEGHLDDLVPVAAEANAGSKGPYAWRVAPDGTIRGRSERLAVSIEFSTADQGITWTCSVAPAEHAPRIGPCAVAGR